MTIEVALPFVVLFILYVLRTPVAYAMLLAGMLGILMNSNWNSVLSFMESSPYRHSATFVLTTIPMFILMAEFLANGKLTRDLFAAASAWLSRFRAGLAMATVIANAAFAALSGSSTAAAATMGRISVPEMRANGYDDRLAIGTVAAAGTFASMVPPSTGLIIYGILTETSIARLFIAGILPGAVTVIGYLMFIRLWVARNPDIAPRSEPVPVRQCVRASSRVWPSLLLVVLLVAGIYTGAMTATEAGAVGAALALVVSVLFGNLRRRGTISSLSNTLEITGSILFMIIGGAVFGGFLSLSRVTQQVVGWVASLDVNPYIILVGIVLVYVFLGMFMDMIVMLTLTLPLTFPLAMNLGFDPIWFGILVIKLGEVGLITPPFGLNVFVASKAARGDVKTAFTGTSRFLIVEVIVIALIIAFPALATWLPSQASA